MTTLGLGLRACRKFRGRPARSDTKGVGLVQAEAIRRQLQVRLVSAEAQKKMIIMKFIFHCFHRKFDNSFEFVDPPNIVVIAQAVGMNSC